MSTSYTREMRLIGEWHYGSFGLLCYEIHPVSGPPDACIAVERTGESWISSVNVDTKNWTRPEKAWTRFAFFLVNPRDEILFSEVYPTRDEMEGETEALRAFFASQSGCANPSGELLDEAENERRKHVDELKRQRRQSSAPPLFELGRVIVPEEASRSLGPAEIDRAIAHHVRGDWGNVTPESWLMRDHDLRQKRFWLESVFRTEKGVDYQVITSGDPLITVIRVAEKRLDS